MIMIDDHGLYGVEESQVIKIGIERVSRPRDEEERPTIAIVTSF